MLDITGWVIGNASEKHTYQDLPATEACRNDLVTLLPGFYLLACRLDPLEESRLMVLRLPPRAGPPQAPHYGMLPVVGWQQQRDHDFSELQYWSAGHLFMAVPQLQVC